VRIGTESSTDHYVFAEHHGHSAVADVECLVACVADECHGTGGVTNSECVVTDNTSCVSRSISGDDVLAITIEPTRSKETTGIREGEEWETPEMYIHDRE
jgi:hypothetical protein